MFRGLKTTTGTPVGGGVEGGGHAFGGVGQHVRKLIHRDHIVVPRKLVRPRRCGAGREIVEMRSHHQRPRIIQSLDRIRPRAQPLGRNG